MIMSTIFIIAWLFTDYNHDYRNGFGKRVSF